MKIKLLLACGAAALSCFAAAGAQASTNLLTNGDFSTETFSPWFLTGGPVTDGQPDRVIDYTQSGNVYGESVPQDPNTSSDFGAYFSSDAPTKHGAGIEQKFVVPTAGEYDITFDYYVPSNGVANPYDAKLTVSDRSGKLVKFDAKSLGNTGWETYSVEEYLKAGKNDLKFKLTVPQNYPGKKSTDVYAADFIVTNVDVSGVSAVPEPAAWAFMLTGFFGMGAALRSRRGKAAVAA
jgi:hypothetical protein